LVDRWIQNQRKQRTPNKKQVVHVDEWQDKIMSDSIAKSKNVTRDFQRFENAVFIDSCMLSRAGHPTGFKFSVTSSDAKPPIHDNLRLK
jgi:hypothetical protein